MLKRYFPEVDSVPTNGANVADLFGDLEKQLKRYRRPLLPAVNLPPFNRADQVGRSLQYLALSVRLSGFLEGWRADILRKTYRSKQSWIPNFVRAVTLFSQPARAALCVQAPSNGTATFGVTESGAHSLTPPRCVDPLPLPS